MAGAALIEVLLGGRDTTRRNAIGGLNSRNQLEGDSQWLATRARRTDDETQSAELISESHHLEACEELLLRIVFQKAEKFRLVAPLVDAGPLAGEDFRDWFLAELGIAIQPQPDLVC